MVKYPNIIDCNEGFIIEINENEIAYWQRKTEADAASDPLNSKEIIIIALCNRIVGK